MEYRKYNRMKPDYLKKWHNREEPSADTGRRRSCAGCGESHSLLSNIGGVLLCSTCADKYGPAIRAEQ